MTPTAMTTMTMPMRGRQLRLRVDILGTGTRIAQCRCVVVCLGEGSKESLCRRLVTTGRQYGSCISVSDHLKNSTVVLKPTRSVEHHSAASELLGGPRTHAVRSVRPGAQDTSTPATSGHHEARTIALSTTAPRSSGPLAGCGRRPSASIDPRRQQSRGRDRRAGASGPRRRP